MASLNNLSLFDLLPDPHDEGFVPQAPPLVASKGIKRVQFNVETDGLRWWAGNRPLSASIRLPDGSIHFVPWRYRGGNLDEDTCRRWAQRELRDLHIDNINTKFDIHMMREWGVDLEAQNCTFSDVSHAAALLDDHRKQFNLDLLAQDFLGGALVERVDESRMAFYHASQTMARANEQVRLVHELREVFQPRIDAEDLNRVQDLENAVIPVVCEMEKNGAPIDVELLDRWLIESKKKYEQCLWELVRLVGFQVDPRRPEHQERLFHHLKIPLEHLASGRASFTDAIMKRHVEHPAIRTLRYANKIASLRSKYLVKYKATVDSNGIIRYGLHQLRSAKDANADAGDAGTVTGRFSSSEITRGEGINIQQEMKASKQRKSFGYDEKDESHDEEIFIIRQLRIPPKGRLWLAADAMQIEYRIFASYANNPRIIQAYKDDPYLSFHELMHSYILPFKPDQTYRQQKDLNFAYVYGAGTTKMALMLEHITQEEFEWIRRKQQYDHPKLAQTKEVRAIYQREVPEVQELLDRAAHIAKPRCDNDCYGRNGKLRNPKLHATEEHRGYVRTILGRRSRFPDGKRLHKAFNSIDQGSGADIAKQKLVELHANRKYTGLTLRYPVHDEVDGDIPSGAEGEESARRIGEILNTQSFPQLKVPILWDVSTGRNWKECG